jgi:hypothetical protein
MCINNDVIVGRPNSVVQEHLAHFNLRNARERSI